MPARKRRKPGPKPGTGGRPASPETRSTDQLAIALWPDDVARIERLQGLWGGSQAAVVRRALEMADDMTRET